MNMEGHFDKVLNFRDLSESDPNNIKSGSIFRGQLHRASPKDLEILTEKFGIRTLLDLRNHEEKKHYHNPLFDKTFPPTKYIKSTKSEYTRKRIDIPLWTYIMNIRLFSDAGKYFHLIGLLLLLILCFIKRAIRIIFLELDNIKLIGMYKTILSYSHFEMLQILEICADEKNYPICIHCSLGKDRTGIVIAIISEIVGVPRENICKEFSKSASNLKSIHDELRKNMRGYGIMDADWLMESPDEVMMELLKFIEEKYGSFDHYITNIVGFSKEKQNKLRTCLLRK